MPTITQLEYIISVNKYKHFGKAAKNCNVSQPSLSLQIQKVEEELDVVIFDRAKKPIMPTKIGEQIIEQAKQILIEHEKLLKLSNEQSGEISGEIRLGVIPTIAPYLVPIFINVFSKQFPKLHLYIDEHKTSDIIELLKNDQMDAAILATPLREKTLREKILFYEPFYLYLSKNHFLLNKKSISESDISGDQIWLLQDGHCFKDQMLNYCSLENDGGVFKNVSFEGGNLETLRYLISKNSGYTLLPHLFVNNLSPQERKNYIRPFKKPIPTREVSLVFRRNHWKSDIIQALYQCIKSTLPKDLNASNLKSYQVLEF